MKLVQNKLAAEPGDTQDPKTFTGVVEDGSAFVAFLDGRYISAFNSKAAAVTGVEVERKRRAKRSYAKASHQN